MASKGPRSKLDHESRARRQKALEAPREPRRPKTHWDHVLEEMVWLSKDFESERKWKLAQAKKVALKASKGMLDQASRGEKKLKEEEQRLRKVAVNISKDVKKFWTKIEKLVLYKHQMELDERKKKALDKQLEFLLGQTERYSTMLAENLVDSQKPVQQSPVMEQPAIQFIEADENNAKQLGIQSKEVDETGAECNSGFDNQPQIDAADVDEDYGVQSEDVSEDDEQTIEEDEALITAEERKEELEALQNETDIPLEELLKRYTMDKVNRKSSPEMGKDEAELTMVEEGHTQDNRNDLPVGSKLDISSSLVRRCDESNGGLSNSGNHLSDIDRSQLRDSYDKSGALTEKRPFGDFSGERDESNGGLSISEDRLLDIDTSLRKDSVDRFRASTQKQALYDFSDEQEDGDFVAATGEDKDDETTLSDEEELAKEDSDNHIDEIALLQKESEIPVEELLARYRKEMNCNETSEDDSDYASALSEDLSGSPAHEDSELKLENNSVDGNVDPAENQLVLHPLTEEQEEGSEKKSEEGKESENRIADAAAAARSAQPTGITFSTTKVRTKFPFLLKFPLREYQHIGLDWLVTLYEKRLNGILADEMGLGKTIMTIAMLAHVACEKGIWGPHLIVVPTSVMLNWETEFLKWCPAFKILTYFGSAKERKFKRQGWLKPNSFHVCITTYRLVIQDCKVFKRKKWKYLILDEAHLIKNWKSQRWQTLLNFNSKRRILLTGTPLQNDLMELWSLMHFLMPHIFQSHQEFKDWFVNPISGMVEGQEKVNKEVVDRLHSVLRPFILRRLKRDVEKQLPMKVEHVINCRLSKRQRNLYEDFIARAETQATLASANFFGMISVIMQLRKVCNHPDLFEGRPIVSSFDLRGIEIQLSSSVCSILSPSPLSTVDLKGLGLVFTDLDFTMNSWESDEVNAIAVPRRLIKEQTDLNNLEEVGPFCTSKRLGGPSIFEEIRKAILEGRRREARDRADTIAWWNSLRCQKKPVYSTSLRELLTVERPVSDILRQKSVRLSYLYSSKLADIVLSPVERFQRMIDLVESFMFVIPAARAPIPDFWCSKGGSPVFLHPTCKEKCSEVLLPLLSPIRPAIVRRQVYFPDRRLIQFDCGKLQELALLLRKLKSEGHRALIFTQMTKMLDILEAFISLYGYTYMRLDGSTQPEERQTLMQRFNSNPKIFLFILSTRSGGVGINLVGADTVIFYDSDWNPAMDQQAQDRCHRIGQTREVHIYRLISESTIEENILKKANQKRALDDLVIQSGGYNTEFFKKLDPMELFSGLRTLPVKNIQKEKTNSDGHEASLSNADVEAALKCVEDEADYMALKRVEQEDAVDDQEFTEEAIGRLEDDELVNEDHVKTDEPTNQGGHMTTNNDIGLMPTVSDPKEERTLAFASKDDDADMLADVKQMAAAAAAAGEAISSFENQLRPIDRYAIRFLELWDPIIDKTAVESEINFEETEWELDRIEKYKEEMEADIDDDEEPFVYESWDADFATEAYRQQVAIAQHQLMEELESAAKEKEDADDENLDYVKVSHSKPKTKKKPKKAKFKSLKKGALTSESKAAKEEPSVEPMSIDDDFYSEDATFSDAMSPTSTSQKKRKNAELAPYDDEESEKSSKKKSKKLRKALPSRATDLDCKLLRKRHDGFTERRTCESMVVDLEHKSASRSKMGGKISITSMPVKRVLMIKPEKVKKGNVWSRDYVPSPDVWLPQEDAILCAVVHEYGPNWCLVSETLYGMTAGGFYRGRYRHPVHCCERFRELIQQYILSAPDNSINEKISNVGSGKALLKVTEDNIRMLLKIAAEQEDNELLLQKHFTALLSSVWRIKSRTECRQNASSSLSGMYLGGRFFSSSVKQTSCSALLEPPRTIKFVNLGQSSKLLSAALNDANRRNQEFSVFKRREVGPVITEKLDLNLVFEREWVESMDSFPPQVDLSIYHSDPSTSVSKFVGEDCHLKDSQVAENRFRDAARACTEDSLVWAASTFPANDAKLRPVPKSQSLGKHKLPLSDSIKSPKSKLRKTLIDHSEILQLSPEPVPTQAVFLKDPDLRFDMTEEAGLVDLDGNLLLDMDQEFSRETSLSNVIPHNYSPDVISGLNDCSILPDYTDFG